MLALLVHIRLVGRHRRAVVINGQRWRYCNHRSHLLRLPCYRWNHREGYCAHHNTTCWTQCPEVE